ncbi:MAG: hypothetical protein LV479_02625 [Methylacidiphilales bacterium]|nr:hypothetical protein [Candidatus Methylacidiphilales bacterium]
MPSTTIRYDWPSLKLLYVGGASHTDIAHALTKDCPEEFDRVRAAIAKASSRDDWPALRNASQTIVSARPEASPLNDSTLSHLPSQSVTKVAAECFSARKSRYLDVTSGFIDRAATQLRQRGIDSLESAALAAKLMLPVHELARDIHGLNAKESGNQVNVNILSEWAGGDPPAIEVEAESE